MKKKAVKKISRRKAEFNVKEERGVYAGGPNARVEGASAHVAYNVCCARTTKKVRGGRSCQVCKGFVAGEGRE